ncbi:nucleotidyltransferase domain-containing protein [Micromonospora sp. NPDC050397]|uniref:nucleotidyltransferase domain-containing protein n=1 Tax=Micromonospora sp. NPDC050397 TaxID=3364279 RepID=UPI00384D838B
MIGSDALDDKALVALAERLVALDGVVAVALGGSRARGTHRPDSDIDLGLYYRGDLDVAGLRALAAELADAPTEVTEVGGWGPWVDGGGWLTVRGWRVDWIYRDLDRVRRIWADCLDGRYEVGFQPGHPLGFYSHAYAGEVALCRVLADPTGELTDLRDRTREYPAALGDALVDGIWEADFAVQLARYGAAGDDPTYAAGCLFRGVGVACQALHGHAREWLINEKAMVASAGRLTAAPPDFAPRAHSLLADVGQSPQRITETIEQARDLMTQVRAAVGRPVGWSMPTT